MSAIGIDNDRLCPERLEVGKSPAPAPKQEQMGIPTLQKAFSLQNQIIKTLERLGLALRLLRSSWVYVWYRFVVRVLLRFGLVLVFSGFSFVWTFGRTLAVRLLGAGCGAASHSCAGHKA